MPFTRTTARVRKICCITLSCGGATCGHCSFSWLDSVIRATQVLETLAKEGMPSRAEITDAAMGDRAECVMLNKGPHIVTGVRVLDDILRRMQSHQSKKRSMLRELRLARPIPDESGGCSEPVRSLE